MPRDRPDVSRNHDTPSLEYLYCTTDGEFWEDGWGRKAQFKIAIPILPQLQAYCALKWDRVKWDGVKWDGVKWDGVKWDGVTLVTSRVETH